MTKIASCLFPLLLLNNCGFFEENENDSSSKRNIGLDASSITPASYEEENLSPIDANDAREEVSRLKAYVNYGAFKFSGKGLSLTAQSFTEVFKMPQIQKLGLVKTDESVGSSVKCLFSEPKGLTIDSGVLNWSFKSGNRTDCFDELFGSSYETMTKTMKAEIQLKLDCPGSNLEALDGIELNSYIYNGLEWNKTHGDAASQTSRCGLNSDYTRSSLKFVVTFGLKGTDPDTGEAVDVLVTSETVRFAKDGGMCTFDTSGDQVTNLDCQHYLRTTTHDKIKGEREVEMAEAISNGASGKGDSDVLDSGEIPVTIHNWKGFLMPDGSSLPYYRLNSSDGQTISGKFRD